jgi:PKD repeat protein
MANGERVDLAKPARLPAGSGSVVQIHYTGNSFVAPEKVQFVYCLDGCDKDWSQPTTYRVAYYTNLKPGNYTFQVKACNNHGIWNKTPETFSFYIAPHFYETWWFRVLCGLS